MDRLLQGMSVSTDFDRSLWFNKSNHVFLWSKTADETDKKKNELNHLFLYFIFVSDHPFFSIYILINHTSIILGWKGSDTNLKTVFWCFIHLSSASLLKVFWDKLMTFYITNALQESRFIEIVSGNLFYEFLDHFLRSFYGIIQSVILNVNL